MITRDAIIREARTWLNTPFHHQGRKKGVGADCIAPVLGVCDRFGIPYVDQQGYAREPDGFSLVDAIRQYAIEIPKVDRKPADFIVMWANPRTRRPQHLGILTRRGILHADGTPSISKVVESDLTESMVKRITNVFRFPGVRD